jgi:hypothetical protein
MEECETSTCNKYTIDFSVVEHFLCQTMFLFRLTLSNILILWQKEKL